MRNLHQTQNANTHTKEGHRPKRLLGANITSVGRKYFSSILTRWRSGFALSKPTCGSNRKAFLEQMLLDTDDGGQTKHGSQCNPYRNSSSTPHLSAPYLTGCTSSTPLPFQPISMSTTLKASSMNTRTCKRGLDTCGCKHGVRGVQLVCASACNGAMQQSLAQGRRNCHGSHRCGDASGHHVVVRFILLHHHPHHLDVVSRVAPITFRIDVAHEKAILWPRSPKWEKKQRFQMRCK